jgi:hypothetical protein
MNPPSSPNRSRKIWFFILTVLLVMAAVVAVQSLPTTNGDVPRATYSRGTLHIVIPFHTTHPGMGTLTVEVLDPEDKVLGRAERPVTVAAGKGRWQEEIKLEKPLSLEDLVWHRLRYRFEYRKGRREGPQGTESISQVLRTPVVHILGQQSYLTGGQAAVRVIATDTKDEIIAGNGAV